MDDSLEQVLEALLRSQERVAEELRLLRAELINAVNANLVTANLATSLVDRVEHLAQHLCTERPAPDTRMVGVSLSAWPPEEKS